MQTSRGVPELIGLGFTGVSLAFLVVTIVDATGVVTVPFPAYVYLIFTMVSLSLSWTLRRLT